MLLQHEAQYQKFRYLLSPYVTEPVKSLYVRYLSFMLKKHSFLHPKKLVTHRLILFIHNPKDGHQFDSYHLFGLIIPRRHIIIGIDNRSIGKHLVLFICTVDFTEDEIGRRPTKQLWGSKCVDRVNNRADLWLYRES
jgi:hypothetical protein